MKIDMNDAMTHSKVKIIGSIDLNQLLRQERLHHSTVFRLLDTVVEDEKGAYSVTIYDENKERRDCGISLIVGRNGVGKSYLFRAFIEFFIDFYWFVQSEAKRPYSNSRYKIQELRYILGDNEYEISREGRIFTVKINGYATAPNDVIIPNIVAAHFGLYDRFPIKRDRYYVDLYNYVGSKAGGNFISTNNIITQMLFSLCEDREDTVVSRITQAFSKVGYDPRVTIRVKIKDSHEINNFEAFKLHLKRQVEISTSFNASLFKKIDNYSLQKKRNLYNVYKVLKRKSEIVLDLNDYGSFMENREYFSSIYLLKQLQLTTKLSFFFYRDSKEFDGNSLSSGEINMLATLVSVSSCVDRSPILILLDEPELNQHPNWQMSIINQLYDIFGDFTCHLLIASHSHFLVSDLPGESSVVIQMDYTDNGLVSNILPENTYGWSAEQVLLDVFHTGTDRNMYLGHMVGSLLDKIKKRELDRSTVEDQLVFLEQVSRNLKNFDPLKKIISSLHQAFYSQK